MKSNDKTSELARVILRFRRHRSSVLPPDLVNEPAWDLLLELFIADTKGLPLTGREVAERSAIPGGVMSRWMMHFTVEGLLVGDGSGNLDDRLTLSGSGMAALEKVLRWAENLIDEFHPET